MLFHLCIFLQEYYINFVLNSRTLRWCQISRSSLLVLSPYFVRIILPLLFFCLFFFFVLYLLFFFFFFFFVNVLPSFSFFQLHFFLFTVFSVSFFLFHFSNFLFIALRSPIQCLCCYYGVGRPFLCISDINSSFEFLVLYYFITFLYVRHGEKLALQPRFFLGQA